MTPLNKQSLITHLTQTHNLTQSEALNQIDNILNSILTLTAENNTTLRIRGFGSFSRKLSAPRKGRNPQTGEAIDIPARSVLKFKPSSTL